MKNGFIKETRQWSEFAVDECIKENYGYFGDSKEYKKLLEFICRNEPTPLNIYTVANAIKANTNTDDFVEAIMYRITDECVITFYKII